MKNITTILVLIIFLAINFFAQTFQKGFTNSNFSESNHYDEEAFSATQTSDGNFLLTGLTRDETGNADVIITKHNERGNIIWEKMYGSDQYDKGYAVAEIANGGIVVAAKTNKLDDDGDWWILRLDENGDSLWTMHIGYTGVDIPYKVIPLENGDFVVAGQVWGFYNCTIRNDDGYIIQLTPEGEEVWHHIVTNSIKDPLRGISQTSDGGFVVCGNAWNEDDGIYDTYAYKIDSVGEKKWTHTYQYNNSDEEYNNQRANAITELPNGELVLVGKKFRSISSNTWNVMFKRLDSGGNILRDTYDYEIGDEEAMDVLVNEDGNLVVVGRTESHVLSGATSSIFVSIYDTTGNKLSQNLLGGNDGHSYGRSVNQTSDSGLIIGGYTTLWQETTPSHGYEYKKRFLAKTDEIGNVNNLGLSKRTVDFGEVEYGETVFDTIAIKNNWLYDIHLSSALQYYSPEVFSLPEGEIDDDTLGINNSDSLRLIIQYTPNSESGGIKDSTTIHLMWDNVCNALNYDEYIDLVGKGKNPVRIFENENTPTKFQLYQNYPNPFSTKSANGETSTTIKFSIANVFARSETTKQSDKIATQPSVARNDNVRLIVYNVLGQQVAELINKPLYAGNYEVEFRGNNLPSGIYFYRLQSGNFVDVKKMILIK